MNSIVRRLISFLAYSLAGIVILLAIAVGLFRLFLPRLPEYQDEIKGWASTAIGMQVEFSGMDARWGLSGPELEFYDAELVREGDDVRIIAAEEVRIGIGLMRLLFDRTLIVDRVVIRDTSIDIRRIGDDSYHIQGIRADDLLGSFAGGSNRAAVNIEVIGEDIELRFIQPGDKRPHIFTLPRVRVSVDQKRIAIDADIDLPNELGRELSVSAIQVLTVPVAERGWDFVVEADNISLPGWSSLFRTEKRFQSGIGDMELALAFSNHRVTNATAELEFMDVALGSEDHFDVRGRVEVDISDSGWLVAAHEFVLAFQDHEWQESTLRVEASVDRDGSIVMLDTRASYLNLDDVAVLEPWLEKEQRVALASFAPSGIVRNLVATVSEIDSNEPRFNISAEFDRVGFLDAPGRPGVRGFSGLVRANRSGGLLEISSGDLEVRVHDYLPEAIKIDFADGTVIWRNSNNRTTILSDSIVIQNEFFYSQSNIQLVLNKDGASPEIDLASTWSISDLAEAKRYIPKKGLSPRLYEWFQMALVSGSIPRGTMSLNGPIDKFPFDGGEGRLLMEASVRNMTFKYHRLWPATEQSDMDIVLDNSRLYTTENRSVSAGIPVVNANIDIPDLRDPVLSIKSFSASTLEAIRDFSMRSPIADVFGGQLDRISVSGDASFTFDLTIPLKIERVQEFEFIARVRSNNGTLVIAGLDPPITELMGEVTIERERISSEGLGGRFLGQDVSISLRRTEDPRFSVIAIVEGTVTGDAIVNDFSLPLEGMVSGATQYEARILFPNGNAEIPLPLTILIESDLEGLAFDLPEPVAKPAESILHVSGDIRFMPGGDIIETAGSAADLVSWQLAFNRPEGSWDFDRGVVTLGGEVMETADTRGLHIRGTTGVVRLQDWLSLSRSGEKNVGAADRIRSIDLIVDDLYVLGQHLQGHRVRVDRSARDWLVQFDGDDIVGSVFVPYDFGGHRAMVLEMEKLRLPGDEAEESSVSEIDPRNLPPIQLQAAEFAFGDRYLGAVTATLEKTENGLRAVNISSKDATYEIVGTGRWMSDDTDPLGSHSFIAATLTSTDVEETMTRLNYQPGIVSNDMSIVFDLNWSGGPRADFFDVLDGEVEVRFGNGQLEEVEPGAGRVFGLMSITALPRRLSFDFRDVFRKGFGFDKIAGTFNIDDGKTLTCDLSLEGPAADIGIVGEADLANRTYNQTAIVSANVGNTLPIVGAVVAGPQVAAVLLIFSQIFKKPLQEVGQVYYGISGSWDEPSVDAVDSDAFVASGELAGCLVEGE
ncbi:MAG: TIGR02099 family protein [Proteobacteria bacterium]|nr:TIGR02099 family protein [Pseudomonadota bacterium]